MTSDRGTRGEPELQVKSSPVSTKGLNPNANEFHSKADSSPTWTQPETNGEGVALMNGDSGSSSPPTPVTDSDYSTMNGNQDAQSVASADSESGSGTGTDTQDTTELSELKSMLLHQLEYYFSRENLNHDSYLVSQMDSDQFVPISTVAKFNQVKKLTTDLSLIVEVLRGSQNVQVDDKGEKVRPLIKRCIVILREIADGTTHQEITDLFSSEKAPKFMNCEFAHNNSWYITFESDEDAQKAYRFLREDIRTFKGVPIMARIKAKAQVQTSYTPKNGVMKPLPTYETSPQPQQQMAAPQQQQQPMPQHTHAPTFAQTMPRFTYPQHMNMNNMPFVAAQQSFAPPFYQHTQTMIPTAWATSPPPFYADPGLALAMNGFQAQAYHKLSNSAGRQGFQAMRNNRNPPKIHNRAQSNPERTSTDNAVSRHHSTAANSAPNPSRPNRSDSSSSDAPSQALFRGSSEEPQGRGQSEPLRDRRMMTYRQRRRKEDEAVKNPRLGASQPPIKETKIVDEKFELEKSSFPPLPGSTNSTTTGDIFESKMSDVVRGTAKAITKPSPVTEAQLKPATTTPTTTSSAAQVSQQQKSKESTPTPSEQQTSHNSVPGSPPKSPIKQTSSTSENSEKSETTKPLQAQPTNSQTPEPKSPVTDQALEPMSARPSYAQMAQRAKAAKEDTIVGTKTKEDTDNNNKDKDLETDNKSTLNDTQVTKGQSSAKANGPQRDSRSEPKDQRPPAGNGGRRNKENRDRRDRRKDAPIQRNERPSSAK